MSADRESIIPELHQVVQKLSLGCSNPNIYVTSQVNSKTFSLTTLNSKFGYYWSKSHVSRTSLAKVIKISKIFGLFS